MRKLLMLIAILTICDAYGAETMFWFTGGPDSNTYTSNSCTIGDNITKPDNPKKTGFRFIGWSTNASFRNTLVVRSTEFTPTSRDGSTTWTATFDWGTATGQARCSSTSGTSCITSNQSQNCTKNANPITTGATKNCWCKVTDSAGMVDTSSLVWVFRNDVGSASTCASDCAYLCGATMNVAMSSGFRWALFGF